jgi:phosphohistidine phosphatase SixA
MKGLARRNTYVKYKIPSTNLSKVMTKVKVIVDGHRQTVITIGHPPSVGP